MDASSEHRKCSERRQFVSALARAYLDRRHITERRLQETEFLHSSAVNLQPFVGASSQLSEKSALKIFPDTDLLNTIRNHERS